jgi:hypothetical protein
VSRVDASRAQVATATALYSQASEFKKAGTVPAIDVLRAQVEMQSQQQKLITLENDNAKQKLRLARAIGLPDGQRFRLTDEIPTSMSRRSNLSRPCSGRMPGRRIIRAWRRGWSRQDSPWNSTGITGPSVAAR